MSSGLKFAIALLAATVLLVTLLWFGKPSSFPWEHNYTAALEGARSRKQLVVAYLYTDWCTYCKKMDAETFSSERVREAAKDFTWLKLDAEDEEDGARLRQQFSVAGYPTVVVLDENGTRLDQFEGFLTDEELLQALTTAVAKRSTLGELRRKVEEAPQSAEVRYAAAEKLLEMKNYRKAADEFSRVIELDPENRYGRLESAYYHLALSLASLGANESAQEQLDRLERRFPDGTLAGDAEILRGQIYFHQGDPARSRRQLTAFLRKRPTHPRAALVQTMLSELSRELPLVSAH